MARVRAGVGFEHSIPWDRYFLGFGLHGAEKQGIAIHGFDLETVRQLLFGPLQVPGRHGEHEKRTLLLRIAQLFLPAQRLRPLLGKLLSRQEGVRSVGAVNWC